MWRIVTLFTLAAVFALSFGTVLQQRLQRGQANVRVIGTIHAPDFPAGVQWLNIDRPLSLKALRGKFVLLDFWTYC